MSSSPRTFISGPGMLGHYSEARAYVNRDDEAQQHADVFLDLDDDPVSKEAIQHDWSGMLFSQEQNPFVDEDNDFILIAECNEVHGPMPLVTIPHNIGDRVENIDINSLVISILSVDYQQVGAVFITLWSLPKVNRIHEIYYRLAHPEWLPFDRASSGIWDLDSGFLDCFSHLHLDKGHGLTLEKQWDAIQLCVHDGSEAIFLQVLGRRVKVEDVLYSLLIGRPIIVVGRTLSAHEVAASAKVLALFAPRKFGDFLWFEDQRFDALDNSSLNTTAVIGFVDESRSKDFGLPSSIKKKASVLSVETGDFSGPCYGGTLLKQTSQRIRLLEENEALLALISSVLSDVEYVAHTWILLSAKKAESKAFAKQRQLTNCDMAILKKGFLDRHLGTHHAGELVCDECGIAFVHRTELERHLGTHTVFITVLSWKPKLLCLFYVNLGFKTPCEVNEHLCEFFSMCPSHILFCHRLHRYYVE
ncbi:hypothetical protein HPB48_016674 [Haemaphysalis longicornis]|uniref:C2H2-type domain-containing protein n=1 Tax=Haemaphysalis longicornis TaxID=44386 RepID=A0A9J6H248_HAELO|nr:hypothetical protein HPB48_016674 [Haemaphysalis longicornis]